MGWIALVGGIAVLVVDAGGVVRVLIVPRSPARGTSLLPMRLTRAAFRHVARSRRRFHSKDRILALSEPVALLVLLATWLGLDVLGFTLVDLGLGAPTWHAAFAEAGSSVFTLGFATGHRTGAQAADFVAAASGMILVALQIAYLPTLYAAFNRRETLVTLLESRAGAPAWGPELLARHHLVGLDGNLPRLWADWERWSADVAESHTSYPSLLYFRSPRALNSWIVSLVAVLDAAAMHLALDPDGSAIEARMCVRMGFTCLRDIAAVIGIDYDPDPDPDDAIALPRQAFDDAVAHLVGIGFRCTRPPGERWEHFRGWRVNYETIAYALATALDAPPAPWTGPRAGASSPPMVPLRPADRQPRTP